MREKYKCAWQDSLEQKYDSRKRKNIHEEILESEMRSKRPRKYELVEDNEMDEEMPFGRGLEQDHRLYLGDLEQS